MEGTIVKRFRIEDTILELDLELLPGGQVMARFVGADAEWVHILDREFRNDIPTMQALFGVIEGVTD